MTSKIRYQICYGRDLETLERTVEQALTEGWVLQGGVCCSAWGFENMSSEYFQAMTKVELNYELVDAVAHTGGVLREPRAPIDFSRKN